MLGTASMRMAASFMAASIAAARRVRKRLRRTADCRGARRLLWARSMTHTAPAPAPETLRVQKTRIACDGTGDSSEEHTSDFQSLMRISYAVFCLKKKTTYEDYH